MLQMGILCSSENIPAVSLVAHSCTEDANLLANPSQLQAENVFCLQSKRPNTGDHHILLVTKEITQSQR